MIGRPFEPGKSGNPGGRPKMSPEEREHWKALAAKARGKLEALVDSADCPPNTLTKIAEIASDQAYGKPVQAVEADITERRPIIIDGAYEEKSEQAATEESH
jgi:hypothetical protein